MNWRCYFDRIFVMSLPGSERRPRFQADAAKYAFPFSFWEATEHEDGRKGIYLSMMSFFHLCLDMEFERVLLFEDDCLFRYPPVSFNYIFSKVCEQADALNWMQLKLGSVLLREPETGLVTKNIFQIPGSYGLHACAYTREFMELAVSLREELPIDVCWMKRIESIGRSYHTYPLLCSQHPGYSSIEKKETNWDFNISGTFNKYTKKIKEQYEAVAGNNNL